MTMSGLTKNKVLDAVNVATKHNNTKNRLIQSVEDYEADNVSKKVLRIILSYTEYVNRKFGRKVYN